MTRSVYLIEANGVPVDESCYQLLDDAEEAAEQMRQLDLEVAIDVRVVRYVPAGDEEVN
jgi:hypothetical protein